MMFYGVGVPFSGFHIWVFALVWFLVIGAHGLYMFLMWDGVKYQDPPLWAMIYIYPATAFPVGVCYVIGYSLYLLKKMKGYKNG